MQWEFCRQIDLSIGRRIISTFRNDPTHAPNKKANGRKIPMQEYFDISFENDCITFLRDYECNSFTITDNPGLNQFNSNITVGAVSGCRVFVRCFHTPLSPPRGFRCWLPIICHSTDIATSTTNSFILLYNDCLPVAPLIFELLRCLKWQNVSATPGFHSHDVFPSTC